MGVRVISSARNFAPMQATLRGGPGSGSLGAPRGLPPGRLHERRHSTPRMTLLFDGTAGKQGLSQALPANEAWLDPMSMLKFGQTQYSMTASYGGAGTCKVYGAQLPADYSVKVEDVDQGPGLVLQAAAVWELITELAPNVAANLFDASKAHVYTLYRFEFLSNTTPGNVVVTAL